MSYKIKEIFYTLQGEGVNAGRAAVFCRFSGCNLWSGREADKVQSVCNFCDTDFVGVDGTYGNNYTNANGLAKKISRLWPSKNFENKFVVITGGEPMLQVDEDLINALHSINFEIAIETNGTIACPKSIDWICVSPKVGSKLIQKRGDELKFVFPQKGFNPKDYLKLDFKHFLIQPMDGPFLKENTMEAINFCKENPHWKLSIQTHKVMGIR